MRLNKLYDAKADWEEKNTECESFLGIPDGTTVHYCDPNNPQQVPNPASDDYEKYIMPVMPVSHPWATISLFDASELVPWNSDWDIPLGE